MLSQVLSSSSRSRWELAPLLLDAFVHGAGRGNSVTLNAVMTGGIWGRGRWLVIVGKQPQNELWENSNPTMDDG